MLRVLHLIYDDPANPWVGGGGAVRVREIYRRLARRLQSVTVATGSHPGSRDEEIEGIRYRRLGSSRPYAWSRLTYGLGASRLLAAGDYDVAVFDFSTYVPIRIPRGRAVGITVHHITGSSAVARWGSLAGRAVAWWEAGQLRTGRHFSATSAATEARLRSLVGGHARITRISAGVPDGLFDLPRVEGDYLLYFGRLDWSQKGLDVLLDAMAALVRERPDIRLKIAGRGKDGDRVAAASRRLGISPQVELLGAVGEDERDRLLSGALMLLMPSRFEGFGMVAAEAMAAGVPVVASDAGSLPEVVDPPSGGVLVPVGDAASLAAAARRLLDEPAERRRLSESARISAGRFRWDAIAEQHLAFLESIHSNSRSMLGREVRE
jgi:glycosyltransferase involved in cell wall biosynthesis